MAGDVAVVEGAVRFTDLIEVVDLSDGDVELPGIRLLDDVSELLLVEVHGGAFNADGEGVPSGVCIWVDTVVELRQQTALLDDPARVGPHLSADEVEHEVHPVAAEYWMKFSLV